MLVRRKQLRDAPVSVHAKQASGGENSRRSLRNPQTDIGDPGKPSCRISLAGMS